MQIPLEIVEYTKGLHKWESGAYIQDAFPSLSPEQREFIKTGITPEEWDYLLDRADTGADELDFTD